MGNTLNAQDVLAILSRLCNRVLTLEGDHALAGEDMVRFDDVIEAFQTALYPIHKGS